MSVKKITGKLDAEAADWFLALELKQEQPEGVLEEQLDDFVTWIQTPGAEEAYGRTEAMWKLSDGLKSDPDILACREDLYQQLNKNKAIEDSNTPTVQGHSHWAKTFIKVACLSMLGFVALYSSERVDKVEQYTADAIVYQTATGERKRVSLPDNTVVTLNTASELHVQYSPDYRHVTLERGEALFDVTPNKNIAFKVNAGSGEIIALGTVFNVRLYENELHRVEVALLKGKISVETGMLSATTTTGSDKTIYKKLLSSKEAISFDDKSISAVSTISDSEQINSWKDGHLYFTNAPLSDIVREVNRYTIAKLVIEDRSLKSERISAYFDVDKGNYDSLLFALQENLDVKWYRRSGVTFLYRD